MSDKNFQQALLAEAMIFLRPLTEAATSSFRRHEVFKAIGWDLDAITGFPIDSLISTLSSLVTLVQRIEQLVENPPQNLDDLSKALDVVGDTIQIVQGLARVMEGSSTPQPHQFDELGADLMNYLTIEYLANHHPTVFALLSLLKILDSGNPALLDDPVLASGKIVRYPTLAPRIAWERIEKLLSDPVGFLKSEYLGGNELTISADAQEIADHLFPLLGTLLYMMGADVTHGRNPSWSIDLGTVGNQLADHTIIFSVPLGSPATLIGASLTLSSSELGNLGLVIVPFGILETSHSFLSWKLDLQLLQTVNAIAISNQGVVLDAQPGTNHFTAKVTLTKLAGAGDEGVAFLIGSTTGTRLKIGQFAIKADVNVNMTEQDYGLLLEVGSASFVFSPGDGDGFLQKVVPPEGFRTDFDLAIGWSSRKGLYFRGSAGLEATLPIHASLLACLQ